MQSELIAKLLQNLTILTVRNPSYKKLYDDLLLIRNNFNQKKEYMYSFSSLITDDGVINLKMRLSKRTGNLAELTKFMLLSRLTQTLFIMSGLAKNDTDNLISVVSETVYKLQVNGDLKSVKSKLENNSWLLTLLLIEIHTDMQVPAPGKR